MKRFNVRVYGICTDPDKGVLVSNETYRDHSFTKFPGGGLEWGEGTLDCLKREFVEEFDLSIEVGELFYFTDFFQQSAFSENDQVLSVYYRIQLDPRMDIGQCTGDKGERLDWIAWEDFSAATVTFPIDKVVAQQLTQFR